MPAWYLNVPHTESREARRLGARWDPERRAWYAPVDGSGKPGAGLRRWLCRTARPEPAPSAGPRVVEVRCRDILRETGQQIARRIGTATHLRVSFGMEHVDPGEWRACVDRIGRPLAQLCLEDARDERALLRTSVCSCRATEVVTVRVASTAVATGVDAACPRPFDPPFPHVRVVTLRGTGSVDTDAMRAFAASVPGAHGLITDQGRSGDCPALSRLFPALEHITLATECERAPYDRIECGVCAPCVAEAALRRRLLCTVAALAPGVNLSVGMHRVWDGPQRCQCAACARARVRAWLLVAARLCVPGPVALVALGFGLPP